MESKTNLKSSKVENQLETSKKEKESIALYFDLDLIDSIADFIHTAKKQLPIAKRRRLNRSLVFHLVMQDVFDDYSKLGNASYLWKVFSKWAQE